MNILTDKIKKVYFKYLAAAFGSTLITSIYGIVDMAMVGQYHGPLGSAALAVFAPIWNIIYSFGLLSGIGGSVMFSAIRGKAKNNTKKANEYFTTAIICGGILTVLAWLLVLFFSKPLLIFFGADETILPLAESYLIPIKFTIPFFVFAQIFTAFLRNDGNPALATASVLLGGLFNVFGDWFFVFAMDLGILGAGIATAMGSVFSLLIMLSHFLGKKNTLKFVRPRLFFHKLIKVVITGFPTCITDITMGVMTILFNRQIMKYLGTNALSVYAVIVNISTFVQCCAYSVGQASQPIFSVNFGAGKTDRINECLKYALYTATGFGIFWTLLSVTVPSLYINIFMSPTKEVLQIAPAIIRAYSVSFLILPLNVFSTYYFQAIMKPTTAFIISIARGCIISGGLILLLPIIAGANAVWYAMLITELLVAIFTVTQIHKSKKELFAEQV